MKATSWFVYIIENEKGHLYTGVTTDLKRRFEEHAGSKKGAKFFRTGSAVKMVFHKKCKNRSEAQKMEAAVKKMKRADKLLLVKKGKIRG